MAEVGLHDRNMGKTLTKLIKDVNTYLITDLRFHIVMNYTKVLFLQLHQEIPRILRHSNVRFRVHKTPALTPIMSQISTVHVPLYSVKIPFNIILPFMLTSSKWSFSLRPPPKLYMPVSSPPHTRHATPPAYFSRLDPPLPPENIWRTVSIMKIPIMRSSPVPNCTALLGPKYLPQRPLFRHPQPIFLPQSDKKFLTQTKQEAKL